MRLSVSCQKPLTPVAELVSGRKRISVSEGVGHLAELNQVIERLDSKEMH